MLAILSWHPDSIEWKPINLRQQALTLVPIANSRRSGSLVLFAERPARVPVVPRERELDYCPPLRQQVGQCEDNRIHGDQYSGGLDQTNCYVLLLKHAPASSGG
jgi:hypothetical protein